MSTPPNRALYIRPLAVNVCECGASKRPNSKNFHGHGLTIAGVYFYINGKARRYAVVCQECLWAKSTLARGFQRIETSLPDDHIIVHAFRKELS